MFKAIVFFALVAAAASSSIGCYDNCQSSCGPVSSGPGQVVANKCQCTKVIQTYRPVSSVVCRPTERQVVQTATRNVVQQVPYTVNVDCNVGPAPAVSSCSVPAYSGCASPISSCSVPAYSGCASSVLPISSCSVPAYSGCASPISSCSVPAYSGCASPISSCSVPAYSGCASPVLPISSCSSPVYSGCASPVLPISSCSSPVYSGYSGSSCAAPLLSVSAPLSGCNSWGNSLPIDNCGLGGYNGVY